MASKGVNTKLFLIVSLLVGSIGYVVRSPLLPLSAETKRSLGYPKESFMNVTQRVHFHGFTAEEYLAKTQDGYVLQLFRVRSPDKHLKGPPILLMHGLIQSADSWVEAGPNAGLAYLLAGAGHDVWLGNVRGSNYGRRHVTLNPDKNMEFWKFCVDEIGRYDLPALIDEVLMQTKSTQLSYIGFSQGAGTFMVMCSELPQYCDRVNIAIGLAPAARQTYTKSVLYRTAAESIASAESFINSMGLYEIFAKGSLSQEFLGFLCQLSDWTAKLCGAGKDLLDSLDALHPGSIDDETLRSLFGHFPAGTSVHNMARYGQSMKTKHFQKFDYGREMNLQLYGSEQPPKYNLSAVRVPFLAIYGRNDALVDIRDVKWLIKRLPNVLEVVEVKDPLWNHLDVTYSRYTKQMIYPKIEEYLRKYGGVSS